MLISTLPSGPLETNAYLVACPETKEAVLIDPAVESFEAVKKEITSKNLVLKKIILTHSHWDHIGDALECQKYFHAPLLVHPLDAPNLENPGSDGLPCWLPIDAAKPDALLNEGDTITFGHITLEVIHTPGHSPGGVCFYNEVSDVLFSGDTLFCGSIGNLSFSTCEPEKMWGSLKKLAKLPDCTVVYPGHGPKTTIGRESWLNKAEELFG
jgi:glyoxylase-like metal-dependent hydrolase (beta-lactamase superfamily II)